MREEIKVQKLMAKIEEGKIKGESAQKEIDAIDWDILDSDMIVAKRQMENDLSWD